MLFGGPRSSMFKSLQGSLEGLKEFMLMGITSRVVLASHRSRNLQCCPMIPQLPFGSYWPWRVSQQSSNQWQVKRFKTAHKYCCYDHTAWQVTKVHVYLCQVLLTCQVLHKSTGGFHIEASCGDAPMGPEKVSQHLSGHLNIFLSSSPPQPPPWGLEPQPITWLYIISQIGLVKEYNKFTLKYIFSIYIH